MAPTKHPDEKYEIEALSKGLAVLEALEGTNFEPVPQQRIQDRTGFNRNLVMRTLKTLAIHGYAVQNDRGEWMIGRRFIRISHAIATICPMSQQVKAEIEDLRKLAHAQDETDSLAT